MSSICFKDENGKLGGTLILWIMITFYMGMPVQGNMDGV
jgi:hypothetical protein